jgi:small subunit ribosomal protein S2
VRVGMPYVNQRWLGGMLTNFQTVNKRLQRLKELELIDFADVAGSSFTKKELLIMRRERDKLAKTLGGIRDMNKVPSVVWIVDTNKEHLAVDEARKLGIPIVAILDTNCDPDVVDYPIPGNDDAIRAVSLLTRVIADAAAEGLLKRHAARTGTDAPVDADAEPLAEWERELLAGAEAGLAADAAPVAEAAPLEAAAVVEVLVTEAAAEPVVEVAEVVEPVAEVAEPVAEVAEPAAAAEPVVDPAAAEPADDTASE